MLQSHATVRVLREFLITALIALAIFLPLKATVQGYEVQYSCMLPNIRDGDWIIVDKAIYRIGQPQRGEVVVFQPPDSLNSEYPFVKRVIGLPGETVEVRDGSVFINGSVLEEPYIREAPRYSMLPMQVPDNEYFVLGDNRNSANDSHNGWTVPDDNLIGKARLTYWPASRLGVIDHFKFE